MPTRTFTATKSSLFATAGTNLGGGNDQHLPVGGPWGSYTFTSAVMFGLDFSGMKAIQSAVLRMKTSSQVHVGFSSTPDFYVARATGSWTANGSSSSSEGGSGWGTSPTVYPGPASTTTGRVGKRAPTGENASFDTDITAIVKAWAPSSIPGGGNAGNYGVVMSRQASGDVTEFQSFKDGTAGDRPQIIVTYTTDTPPPAPTITGPTGTGTSLRPALTATAVDPDGDPLEVGDVEVYKAAAVVYSALAVAAASSTTLSHVPTADLPGGDLTVRWRARAAGVWGAWSAQAPFTIDRPPSVTSWSAPPASIGGGLRPVHTWTSADPDGDPLAMWDLEVYATTGGVAVGSPVYSALGQTSGIAGYTISHTPTANLTGGPLVARSRVQARGVWSAWSAWYPYTLVTANPTATWVWPPSNGGALLFISYHPDPTLMFKTAVARYQVDFAAPSGATFTRIHRKTVRTDGPGAPSTLHDSDIANVAGLSTFFLSQPFDVSTWGGQPWGTVQITIDAYSSNGGLTTIVRNARFALGEWYGAVFLGDNVTALAAVEDPPQPQAGGGPAVPDDIQTTWYRAQSSPSAPVAGATWQRYPGLATVLGQLPAVGAYLGLAVRMARTVEEVDITGGQGSFETGLGAWSRAAWVSYIPVAPSGGPGGGCLRITGNGVNNWPSSVLSVPVQPGQTYRLAGWGRAAGSTTSPARIRMDAYDPTDKINVASGVTNNQLPGPASGTWLSLPAGVTYTVPSDGSVGFLHILVYIDAAPPNASQLWDFDGLTLMGRDPARGGYRRLRLDWTSAG